jgi:hypothetical protein
MATFPSIDIQYTESDTYRIITISYDESITAKVALEYFNQIESEKKLLEDEQSHDLTISLDKSIPAELALEYFNQIESEKKLLEDEQSQDLTISLDELEYDMADAEKEKNVEHMLIHLFGSSDIAHLFVDPNRVAISKMESLKF